MAHMATPHRRQHQTIQTAVSALVSVANLVISGERRHRATQDRIASYSTRF